ncbi:ATP binding protein [Flavobacterium anhuiense]|uniref:ATP binding protein n=1 Tax=Flavobacterium anhuiense TaxID=459526 RepID=A0A444W1K4_9FLAO|nr:AAA family ATPase [Flavobacterium anhuiense]RYJ39654.1 ATP binding protein [Flavobacterium anhuiense]
MKLNTLELTNVRGFTYAKLDFQPGFNLIVGINGVGKTTVLESLRIVLSHILTEIKAPVITKESFKKTDININTDQLQVNTNFYIDGISYDFVYSKSSKDYSVITVDQKKRTNESDSNTREEGITLEDKSVFTPTISRKNKNNLLGIFFSTKRSVITNQKTKAKSSLAFSAPAYVESLSENRAFNTKTLAEWYHFRKILATENPNDVRYSRIVELIQQTILSFLPEFSELDLIEDEITNDLTFCIKKGKKKLNFTQLSDGERGILALVFDIARRLIIANSDAVNPLHGEAIILIDELDLHLHPKWQRTIVQKLKETFPKCQFIATTHSPQIISSVLPENIQIIKDFQIDHVVKSYGLDINYVLKYIMEDDDRLDESKQAIATVQKLIDEIEFEKARDLIQVYKKNNLDLSEWVILGARMSHLEMFDDEEDN